MLQVLNVHKSYTIGDFTQVALDGVSLTFRKNEFVAVLGPSGSGKTTLLNIVGGLDRYDDGDLAVDGTSTSAYSDRQWDTYRNNRVGFVFQSYNLIPHQSVLANVELALTLSGVSRTERRRRAATALEQVGLAEHVHKRPSQLSGGQMQRVAIARALINDPEILLADEPTGALDSHTSGQIMALLTEIARDRLVIMVTHNADLAEQYATRTVTLTDGAVVADTDPHLPEAREGRPGAGGRKTRMGFLTALGLSFKNLMTKRGRTLMTAFAGSIGIIGIAAILALANGVDDYIREVEEDTLSMYPLSIQGQGVDMTLFLTASADLAEQAQAPHDDGRVHEVQTLNGLLSSVGSNDLGSLKNHFEAEKPIEEHVTSVHYAYDVAPQIYSENDSGGYDRVHPVDAAGGGAGLVMGRTVQPPVFSELMEDTSVVQTQHDVVSGRWPERADELLIVLTPSGDISDFTLYAMGLRDRAERDEMLRQMAEREEVTTTTDPQSFTADELMDVTLKLAHASDYYVYDEEYDLWVDKREDDAFLTELVRGTGRAGGSGPAAGAGRVGANDLKVVGVIQPSDEAAVSALQPGIFYTPALTRNIMEHATGSDIVQSQLADKSTDVFTSRPFSDEGGFAREDFDIASLLSIDEDAIVEAFTLDETALSIDPSALSLSLPDLALPEIDIPELTLPDIALDPSDLPPLELGGLLEGIELEDLGIDEEDAAAAVAGFVTAYMDFVTGEGLNPGKIEENLPLFLESDTAAELLEEMGELTAAGQDLLEGRIQGVLGEYLQTAASGFMNDAAAEVGASLQQQISGALESQLSAAMGSVTSSIGTAMDEAVGAAMGQIGDGMADAMSIDEEAFAEAFEFDLDEDELTELMLAMVLEEERTADSNLRELGYADPTRPSDIDIYPKSFEAKAAIIDVLDDYNEEKEAADEEEKVITYTDLVGTLMSSVTDILNVITYVLVAFVGISLVVSSIMIGVITFISVLERRQEIGILRAIGASKRDIRRVFNAETLIIGFLAGVLGIATTFLLTLPANAIVKNMFDIERVAVLPWAAAFGLVGISMALTFTAGLLPSSAAARKDPVEALRST